MSLAIWIVLGAFFIVLVAALIIPVLVTMNRNDPEAELKQIREEVQDLRDRARQAKHVDMESSADYETRAHYLERAYRLLYKASASNSRREARILRMYAEEELSQARRGDA